MKQKLFFLIIPVFIFVLSGCSKDNSVETPSINKKLPAQSIPVAEVEEVMEIEEQTIETEVDPIDNYESTDELMEDIDAMVDDLDNI